MKKLWTVTIPAALMMAFSLTQAQEQPLPEAIAHAQDQAYEQSYSQSYNQPAGQVANQPYNQATDQGYGVPYYGPSKVTVAQAKTMWDDSEVILEGQLGKRLTHEHFVFRDETGEMVIELDDDWYRYQNTIKSGQKARIYGEVDAHGRGNASIEVDHIEIIQ